MRNIEKSREVRRLCAEILLSVNSLEEDKNGSYFDYDGVFGFLEQASELLDESMRYPRPADLPAHLVWDERPWGGDDIDPYVYTGTMSGGDYGHLDDDLER
ncbi:MAG: hypothetical protein R3Y47_12905 [Lachnospiraceae bacterium]